MDFLHFPYLTGKKHKKPISWQPLRDVKEDKAAQYKNWPRQRTDNRKNGGSFPKCDFL